MAHSLHVTAERGQTILTDKYKRATTSLGIAMLALLYPKVGKRSRSDTPSYSGEAPKVSSYKKRGIKI